jgi:predicted small secreted protein
MKRSITTLTILALLSLAVWLPACNTTKGLGTDIEKAGGGLKHAAERNGAQ